MRTPGPRVTPSPYVPKVTAGEGWEFRSTNGQLPILSKTGLVTDIGVGLEGQCSECAGYV